MNMPYPNELDPFMPMLEVEEPDWIHQGPNVPDQIDPAELKDKIVDNISQVYDPEIPVNIYELGLIYKLDVAADGAVNVLMTLTAPNCPVAGTLPEMVRKGVEVVPGVRDAKLDLTWEPPWGLEMASEDARLALGF